LLGGPATFNNVIMPP